MNGTRWDHKWGFTDTYFEVNDDDSVTLVGSRYPLSGTRMYSFLPFAREVLGVDIDPFDTRAERDNKIVPAARTNESFLRRLRDMDEGLWSTDPRDRLIHSHGQTTSEEVYHILYDSLPRVVDLVVRPRNEEEIEAIVAAAAKCDVCLIPYGGGTNVSGALIVPAGELRMVVSVDLIRMDRLLELDRENLTATFEAGIMGDDLEDALKAEGFTSGHEPDSIELSSLGGWIATNASGMKKNRYGNIEDIVQGATMITPSGRIESAANFPRRSIGIDPLGMLIGSEGNFGIITKATIRIHPTPEEQEYGSLLFHSESDGVAFMYELAHSGTVPASFRIVDNLQFRFGQALKGRNTGLKKIVSRLQRLLVTRIFGYDPLEMVVATIVMEGSRDEVRHQKRVVKRIAKRHRGFSAGASNGRQGYMLTFAIAYIRDFLTSMYILGETFETTVPWSKILSLTKATDERVRELCKEYSVPGMPFLSYRITQLYQTGVCVYFTLGLYLKGVDNPPEVLGTIEHKLRETILAEGGSLFEKRVMNS